MENQTNITAHSGCDGTEDNSLKFVDYVLQTEADCLEVDVRAAADGTLVLGHDAIGGMPVKLADVFQRLRGKSEVKINCDLKEPGLEPSVYALAEQYNVESQLIYSGAVNPETLDKKQALFPKAEIYLNIEQLVPMLETVQAGGAMEQSVLSKALKEALQKATRYDCLSCINMEYHLLSDETIEKLKELGLRASAWTVNEAEDLCRLLRAGITNITTRSLKKALALRSELVQSEGRQS